MKQQDNTQNENERQPVEAALSSGPPAAITRLFVWGWCVCDVEDGEGVDCILPTLPEAQAFADLNYGPLDVEGLRCGGAFGLGEREQVEIFPGLCLRRIEGEARVHRPPSRARAGWDLDPSAHPRFLHYEGGPCPFGDNEFATEGEALVIALEHVPESEATP